MLNYYGGLCISEINETCTHAFAVSYDSTLFENIKSLTNDKIKFITPDWINDCIDNSILLDETIYNPKYLITNVENESLLIQKNINESENLSKSAIDFVDQEHQQHANKLQNKSRNYILGTENFFNQSDSLFLDSANKINLVDPMNQLPQTPNSKSKCKKSRSKIPPVNQQLSNQQNRIKNAQTTTTTTPSTFNIDMNEIFQSVICDAMNSSISKPKPILLELIENKKDSYFDDIDHGTSIFSLYNETYFTQENSHLIKFNNCLLGCVFYLKDFENFYTNETLIEWQKMIENYGGKSVEDYASNVDQITHVLCKNRNSAVYKTALEDDKRIVTQFWLEDVLEEEKLKPPWRAYHFPSVFDRENGPLKNHVRLNYE
jgi:hypothetical protein